MNLQQDLIGVTNNLIFLKRPDVEPTVFCRRCNLPDGDNETELNAFLGRLNNLDIFGLIPLMPQNQNNGLCYYCSVCREAYVLANFR